ncbi:TonB-dependent receptor [Belliella sp. DSM 111904]|uniref:TonB-dependent receptor n=1 Tax=Belliella filtrata TaxID=2923435 RepID=A0ABS9UVA0_9BACT|nr:TonB-dependent receptor [Belliella filtrata]MCH7408091.1 TonB-dependent receptor [Belliella filtrata]
MKRILYYSQKVGRCWLFGMIMQVCCIPMLHAYELNFQSKDLKQVYVDIEVEQASLAKVFSLLDEKTDFSFVYDSKYINGLKPVSLKSEHESLEEVLKKLSASHQLSFQQVNDRISVKSLQANRQNPIEVNVTITGKVYDSEGIPLPGATVRLEGTNIGVATGIDGDFTINAPEDGTLIISYIGFVPFKLTLLSNQTDYEITLQVDDSAMEEVVVVGYGEQKRANLLGAVESITTEKLVDIPAANMSSLLQGRMAGVNVGGPTGRPGSPSSFNIRGSSGSLNAEPVLFVIDGFIRDQAAFDVLDPTEVESISVLKDAAAAVYGARGVGGVVLVTTKRGKEGKARISYSGSVGLADATSFPEMMSAYDQATFKNNQYRITNPDDYNNGLRLFGDDELEAFRNYDFNWMDYAWKGSMVTRHTVNVSGGSDKVRYFGGASYYNEDANLPGTDLNKYSLRMGIDADITKDLTASLTLSGDQRKDTRPHNRNDGNAATLNGAFQQLLRTPRWIPPYINGLPVRYGGQVESHPIEIGNVNSIIQNTGSNLIINAALEYRVPVVEGLRLKVAYNQSEMHEYSRQLRKNYRLYDFQMIGSRGNLISNVPIGSTLINNQERLQEDYDNAKSYQFNAHIAYDRVFGKHDVSGLVVYEVAESESHGFRALRENQLIPGYDLQPGFNEAQDATHGWAGNNARLSSVGRFNYSYDGKYLFESAFRYEGSVRFPPETRWGFFPSASVGWRISDENFFRNNINFVEDMKLRFSAGLLGNDAIGTRQWEFTYGQTGGAYLGGNGMTNGLNPRHGGLALYGQTWEKTEFYNWGIDLLMKNRLKIGLDGFYRYTYDILTTRASTIPTSTGINVMPAENFARMDAWGFDASFSYSGNIGNDFGYNIGVVGGWSRNRQIEIYQNPANIGTWIDQQGLATGGQDGLIAVGIIRTQEQLDQIMEQYPGLTIFGMEPQLGMMMYEDVGGPNRSDEPDGVIDGNDVRMIAPAVPNIGFSFNLGATYKGLRVDTQVGISGIGTQVFFDQQTYNPVDVTGTGSWMNMPAIWNDHWTPENPNAAFPRPTMYGGQNNRSTFWMRDGTTMNLNIVNVSYSLPNHLAEKLGVPQLRMYFTARNLWRIINPFDYKDPSLSRFDTYPTLRTLNFGLNVTI